MKVLISKLIDSVYDSRYEIYNEASFSNMSFLLPNRDERERCVFVLKESFLKKVDDSVKMIITTPDLKEKALQTGKGVCVTEDPRNLFYSVHNYLAENPQYCGKCFKTSVGDNCSISKMADVAEKGVTIGNNVVIESFVKIESGVEIGDNTIIKSGAVIGPSGYDFKRIGDELIPTAHVGKVIIGKNVLINPNTVIVKPFFPYEETNIGDYTKIGGLCYIAHGVKLGKRVKMPNCVSVSGYTVIGDDVLIGPNATISNLIKIGNNSQITIGSCVATNAKDNSHLTGYFAIEHDKYLKGMLKNINRDE